MVQKSRASPCASSQRRSLPQQNSNSTRRADSLHRSHTSPWYVYRVSNVRLCTQSQRRGQSQYRLDSCVASLQHSVSVERGSHSVRAHPRNTPRQLTSPCTLYAPSTQPRQQIRALQATGAQDIVAERTPQRPTCRRAQQATWGRSSTRLQVRQTSSVGYLHATRHNTVRHTYVGRDVRHTFVRAAGGSTRCARANTTSPVSSVRRAHDFVALAHAREAVPSSLYPRRTPSRRNTRCQHTEHSNSVITARPRRSIYTPSHNNLDHKEVKRLVPIHQLERAKRHVVSPQFAPFRSGQ